MTPLHSVPFSFCFSWESIFMEKSVDSLSGHSLCLLRLAIMSSKKRWEWLTCGEMESGKMGGLGRFRDPSFESSLIPPCGVMFTGRGYDKDLCNGMGAFQAIWTVFWLQERAPGHHLLPALWSSWQVIYSLAPGSVAHLPAALAPSASLLETQTLRPPHTPPVWLAVSLYFNRVTVVPSNVWEALGKRIHGHEMWGHTECGVQKWGRHRKRRNKNFLAC